MVKKLIGLICMSLVLIFTLALGNTSLSKLAQDSEFKNPFVVLSPVFQKIGSIISSHPVSISSMGADDTQYNTPTPGATITPIPTQEATTETIDAQTPEPTEDTTTTDDSQEESNTSDKVTMDDLNELVSQVRTSGSTNTEYERTDWESKTEGCEIDSSKYNRNDCSWKLSIYLNSEDPFSYTDPYTMAEITDQSKLDYDHIIPLHYVAMYSDRDWTAEEREQYAYDQTIGVDVSSTANRSKGDKGPADWHLDNDNNANYCYSWLKIAAQYDIALRQKDIDYCKLQCMNAIDSGYDLKMINEKKDIDYAVK